MKCPVCDGGGKHHYYVNAVCEQCKGIGAIPDDRAANPACPPCGGTGRHHYYKNKLCDVCGGWGRLPEPVKHSADGGGVLVSMVEAGKPRTAHIQLEKLFSEVTGIVRVCDPYYGTGSLLRLDLLTKCSEVRFLTRTPDSGEKLILPKAIAEFKKEHANTHFRCSASADFHDRYVLSDKEIILLGHGLKDLGNKESFVVKLPDTLAHDVIAAARQSFDNKWHVATAL